MSATLGAASETASGTASATDGWVSVSRAAEIARVSARTVHRWIAAGVVVSDVTEDGRRRVLTASLPRRDSVTDSGSDIEGDVSDTAAAELVAQLERERDHLEGEVAFLRARVEEAEKAAEQNRVLMLENTRALRRAQEDARQAREDARQAQAELAAEREKLALPPAPARSWWDRVFGGVRGRAYYVSTSPHGRGQ